MGWICDVAQRLEEGTYAAPFGKTAQATPLRFATTRDFHRQAVETHRHTKGALQAKRPHWS